MKCSDELCGWTEGVPAGGRLDGYVWWCGDDYCDCTQPQIMHRLQHPAGGYKDITKPWQGTFQTDGEGYNDAHEWKSAPSARTELNRMAQHLRRHHHDLYVRINWPWSGE